MASTLYYFAYGSNLHPRRLGERVPSSRFHDVVTLAGYRLRWHKRGHDGSGKCNVQRTGHSDHRVIGALYRIASAEKSLLDKAEGLGNGYDLAWATFDAIKAFFYVAHADHIDDALQPYHWYHRFVVEGAAHHRLPTDYQAELATISARPDPDLERTQHHERLLCTTVY